MEQEKGCGWGCALPVIGVVVLGLCLVPFIGLPIAMIGLVAVLIFAFISRKRESDRKREEELAVLQAQDAAGEEE